MLPPLSVIRRVRFVPVAETSMRVIGLPATVLPNPLNVTAVAVAGVTVNVTLPELLSFGRL
jgi:hypothetical protein